MDDETHDRRRSDRWQQWTAIAFMWVTGLTGAGILVTWLGWYVLHAAGWHGGVAHACDPPMATWEALYGSTVFLLVSSVFAGGSPGRTGRNMMEAIISRVRSEPTGGGGD